jgi:hypothetical protein
MDSNGHPIPKDLPNWRTSGFPLAVAVYAVKVSASQVEYQTDATHFRDMRIKFHLPPNSDPATMLAPFLISGDLNAAEVKAKLDETYQLLARAVFTGDLASVPPSNQLTLLRLANLTGKGLTVKSERFKEQTYFSVDVGTDGQVYNTVKLNQPARVAHVVNTRLLALLKAVAAPLKGSSSIYGVQILAQIDYADFLDSPTATTYRFPEGHDDMIVYAPATLIQKFTDADITNQEFIDGCTVIVGGNRVKVDLSLGG